MIWMIRTTGADVTMTTEREDMEVNVGNVMMKTIVISDGDIRRRMMMERDGVDTMMMTMTEINVEGTKMRMEKERNTADTKRKMKM